MTHIDRVLDGVARFKNSNSAHNNRQPCEFTFFSLIIFTTMDANNTVEYRLLPTVDGFATTKYQLSDTDNSSAHLHTPQLFIYKNHSHKPDFMPTEKLIDGLRSTLNQYPIVAGKLVTLENDDIEIHPSDEGILFKETHCEKDISEFDPNWPQGSLRLDWLPVAWDEGPKTIVAIQVTRFANNSGLVLGLSGLHTMADGCGWTMFLHTWAAFVRGETPPPPELNRQLLRVSDEHRHLIKRQRPETREKLAGFFNAFTKKKEVMIRISSEKMAQLKKDAIDSLSEEERNSGWFSTIDAIVAMLWRAATRARNVPDDKVLKELSAIDMRIRIPNFPRNYFGNAVEAPAFGMTAGDIKTVPSAL
ncbi:transferase [Syncephalis plumigaleata]|nr:transferase [Syncephalis plumigaleata]